MSKDEKKKKKKKSTESGGGLPPATVEDTYEQKVVYPVPSELESSWSDTDAAIRLVIGHRSRSHRDGLPLPPASRRSNSLADQSLLATRRSSAR